jgi:hypothetical protein
MVIVAICGLVLQMIFGPATSAEYEPHDSTDDIEYEVASGSSLYRDKERDLFYYTTRLTYEKMFGESALSIQTGESLDVRKSAEELFAQYEIQGVIRGRVPKVVLLNRSNSKTVTISIGETINEMRLIAVKKTSVTFDLLGESYEISY